MKNYNVDEISKILSVDNETVRRWIRKGILPNSGGPRKNGKVISETQLINFLAETPKYMSKAVDYLKSSFLNNPASFLLGVSAGAIGAGIASLLLEDPAEPFDIKKNEKQIMEILDKERENSIAAMNRKEEEISKLQNELEQEQKRLSIIVDSIKRIDMMNGGQE